MISADFSAQELRDIAACSSNWNPVWVTKSKEGIYFQVGQKKVFPVGFVPGSLDLHGEEFSQEVAIEFFEQIPKADVVRVLITDEYVRLAGIVNGNKH